MQKQKIRIAHSPDSDDAFMFYALANNKIETPEFEFEHILSDIETLNQKALAGEYEVSAISFHAYPQIDDKYALLSSGSSMGDNYGPMVIAREQYAPEVIKEKTIAIPGKLTTAYLALQLYQPELNVQVMKFDEIVPAVAAGKIDLGLIIHESQLTYANEGVCKILDLGQWWYEETGGLPLPLGGNVIRRDLGIEVCAQVSAYIKQGIAYALEHRQEAREYALSFARGMDPELADRFIAMYVNTLTLDYGERGVKALH